MYNMYDFTDIISVLRKYRNGTTTTISIIIVFLTIIAMWRIFEKAHESGWKSLIPIYNNYILCKIVGLSFWLFIISIICLFIPFANILALIYIIYFYLTINFKLARSFGHGFLFGLGLIFLNTIFILIIGFSKDKYHRHIF